METEVGEGPWIGQRILRAEMADNKLRLDLGGWALEVRDAAQECCEIRWMHTDDDVHSLEGHTLLRIEARDGPSEEGTGGVREACFVEVATDGASVTLVSYNDHNGYYGGFNLSLRYARQMAEA